VNFHRNQLLTDSDKRKYKELFSKLISSLEPNSLPQLSAIKPKVMKISNNVNLYNSNILNVSNVLNDVSSQNNQNENSTLVSGTTAVATTTTAAPLTSTTTETKPNLTPWVTCSEVPITFKPQLPLIPHSRGQTKTNIVRQVTNVVKRHNFETRQQIFTDKII
jgi:hypothetical protein